MILIVVVVVVEVVVVVVVEVVVEVVDPSTLKGNFNMQTFTFFPPCLKSRLHYPTYSRYF